MKSQKKSYIGSKIGQISLVQASSTGKQYQYAKNTPLQEKIDRLVQENLRVFEKKIRTAVESHVDPKIPISVFNSASSTLEIVVKYLHEILGQNFADIAILLQRDQRTIWHAYRRSLRRGISLVVKKTEFSISSSLFAQRKYSPLEVLVSYLRDAHQLSFVEIARLLALSSKTIWTVYRRKKIKDEKNDA